MLNAPQIPVNKKSLRLPLDWSFELKIQIEMAKIKQLIILALKVAIGKLKLVLEHIIPNQ